MDTVKDLFYGVLSDCTHLQRQSATCAAAFCGGHGEPEQGVLRSGFLRRHVMMSLTISYEGQAGQKCRGWLSCRYIFLRAKPDYGLHMSAKSCAARAERSEATWAVCGSRVNFASPRTGTQRTGPGPPTARHGGTTSTALKKPER